MPTVWRVWIIYPPLETDWRSQRQKIAGGGLSDVETVKKKITKVTGCVQTIVLRDGRDVSPLSRVTSQMGDIIRFEREGLRYGHRLRVESHGTGPSLNSGIRATHSGHKQRGNSPGRHWRPVF